MSTKQIPDISLVAAGSRRKIPLGRLGRPAVLLFLWQETESLGEEVRLAVRPLAQVRLRHARAHEAAQARVGEALVERPVHRELEADNA